MRIAALLLVALPLVAAAQTYKWKDEHGNVHYTQVPPKSGPFETIGPAAPPSSAPNQESLRQSLEQSGKAAAERQKATEQTAAAQAQRQEECRKALERVAYLDARPARRLRKKDEQGNLEPWSEEEHRAERAQAQGQVQENCD